MSAAVIESFVRSNDVITTIDMIWPGAPGRDVATPVSFGVVAPRGKVQEPCHSQLQLASGENLAAQLQPLTSWPDGSTRWMRVDVVLPENKELEGTSRLVVMRGSAPPTIDFLSVVQRQNRVEIVGGRLRVRFSPRGSWKAAAAGERQADDGEICVIGQLPQLMDKTGRVHAPQVKRIRTLAMGPIRATVEVEAAYSRVGGLRLVSLWNFYAGTPLVTADITLHNPRRARHVGGLWDLGDAGSILFRELSVPICIAGNGLKSARLQCEEGQPWHEVQRGSIEIYQDSSGGENWESQNHVNRNGVVSVRFRGYQAQAGETRLDGQRAAPTVEIAAESSYVRACIPEFWQQFPKAIEANDGRLTLRLFPMRAGDLHELQGGEQKTHRIELLLQLAHDEASDSRAPSTRPKATGSQLAATPLLTAAANGLLPGLPEWDSADSSVLARLDQLADEFLSGPSGLLANRELVDEYGWRNYGDVHANHEEQAYQGEQPLVSHYNNQFDLLCGCLLQYLRTGDQRFWEIADPLARHVIDIDIYHTTQDRPAYSGGMFWFTDHFLHAKTCTHRTYSRYNQPPDGNYGGGPGSEHNFTTGLLLYHLLTGNRLAREAVLSLADWVLAMDDGRLTVFGAVDDGPTGLASRPQSPGRGVGNSVNALLDGWLLTHNCKYLNYSEELIRRCIHPCDDLMRHSLLEAERNWSYTVFLVSLDKYLRCKSELGDFDHSWAYARESIVHYGEWMLEYERSYFDAVQELEYPSETWAAQDFRKANALRLAARYADEPIRSRMFQRGDELADRAWNDLLRFETRTTARAMAIVMTEGVRDAELRTRANIESARSRQINSFGLPAQFLTQRERIKRRLMSLRGMASLVTTAARPTRWQRLLNHR